VHVVNAQFRPEANGPSVYHVYRARMERWCDHFAKLANSEEFRLLADEFVHMLPELDRNVPSVQEKLEPLCLRFWWKPLSGRKK
jgi:hypothetical protein